MLTVSPMFPSGGTPTLETLRNVQRSGGLADPARNRMVPADLDVLDDGAGRAALPPQQARPRREGERGEAPAADRRGPAADVRQHRPVGRDGVGRAVDLQQRHPPRQAGLEPLADREREHSDILTAGLIHAPIAVR